MASNDAKSVLVVEDEQEMLNLVSLVLEDEGYQVRTAMDGREGLRAVDKAMPDLILLDMKMPVMNGWEFAREYRKRNSPRAPIVVLTATPDARKVAEEIGAVGWISKPFDLDTLTSVVGRNIGKKE